MNVSFSCYLGVILDTSRLQCKTNGYIQPYLKNQARIFTTKRIVNQSIGEVNLILMCFLMIVLKP